MKLNKIITAIALALCVGLLAGCALEQAADAPNIGLANPMVQVDTAEAFSAAGVEMDAPAGAEDIKYFIISGSIAHIDFILDGQKYIYRASAAEKEIAGIGYELSAEYILQAQCGGFSVDATVYSASGHGMLAKWEHDGVNYTLWHEGELDTASFEAAVLGAMARTFGSSTQGQTAALVEFKANELFTADLDGDGIAEQIVLNEISGDELGVTDYCILNISTADGKTHTATLEIQYAAFAAAYDIDADGLTELFISGDMMSDDFITYVLRYDGSALNLAAPEYAAEDDALGQDAPISFAVSSFNGMVQKIEQSAVYVSQCVDMLGSRMGITEYVMAQGEFRFAQAENAAWIFTADVNDEEAWKYIAIETAAEFPVRMDGTAEDAALPIGTRILITEISGRGENYSCRFVTRSGEEGTLNILRRSGDDAGIFINGIAEADCFTELHYAG